MKEASKLRNGSVMFDSIMQKIEDATLEASDRGQASCAVVAEHHWPLTEIVNKLSELGYCVSRQHAPWGSESRKPFILLWW